MTAILKKAVRALLVSGLLCAAALAQESGNIFVVRHAEKQSEADQALLSDVGRMRGQCLAQTLRDAGIKTVLVTSYERTKQTAEPLVSATQAKVLTFDQ